ncbi:hypothetical protein [Streptomyces sp. SID5910]|uniref:hypothetical protein n=1 Tax=Streptomyces sp. SID5910 TaxID=2690312 RepID=UPI001F39DDF5|nr:hypothetical protein [Streptomyces sp. SID5910]
MAGVMVLLAFDGSTRVALVVGAVWLALLGGVHALWVRPRREDPQPGSTRKTTGAGPSGDPAGLEEPARAPR